VLRALPGRADLLPQVTDQGQVDGINPDVLQDATFMVDDVRGVQGDRTANLLEGPVFMTLLYADEWNVWFYVPKLDGEGLCLLYNGVIDIDDRGRARAAAAEVELGDGWPWTLSDVSLAFGADAAGTSIAGFEFAATVDERDLDGLVDPRALGLPMWPCPDGESKCLKHRSWSGVGRRDDSAATREAVADAASCGAPGSGSADAICSTLGTAGVGAWLVGVFALALRRRSAGVTR